MPVTRPTFDGFDVSNIQGAFTGWAWSVQQGARMGSAKATQGQGFKDPDFAANRAAMKAAGLRWRGAYHWTDPTAPVTAQLANFVSMVGDLEPGEFIQIDNECEPGQTMVFEQAYSMMLALEGRYPGRVCNYIGRWFNGNQGPLTVKPAWIESPLLNQWPWWIAWYDRPTPPPFDPRPYFMWQWAGGNTKSPVVGVAPPGYGPLDSNQIMDAAVLDRLCGLTAPTTPQENPIIIFQHPQFYNAWILETGAHVSADSYTFLLKNGYTLVTEPHVQALKSCFRRSRIDVSDLVAAPNYTGDKVDINTLPEPHAPVSVTVNQPPAAALHLSGQIHLDQV